MFGPLGFPEVVFIVVLALLIFGPKRLPELGKTLGRGLGEFRRASNELKRTFNAELSLDDDEERPSVSRRSLKPEEAAEREPARPAPQLRPAAETSIARQSGGRDEAAPAAETVVEVAGTEAVPAQAEDTAEAPDAKG